MLSFLKIQLRILVAAFHDECGHTLVKDATDTK